MFEGKLNRLEYFYRVLAVSIVVFISQLFAFDGWGNPTWYLAVHLPLTNVAIVVNAIFVVKRLRDLDRPGSHYFLLWIPLYNLYFGFVLLLKKGDSTESKTNYRSLKTRKELTRGSQGSIEEDKFFEQAYNEIESNSCDKATWARVFAEEEGDQNRAKAKYIRLRAARLLAEQEGKNDNPKANRGLQGLRRSDSYNPNLCIICQQPTSRTECLSAYYNGVKYHFHNFHKKKILDYYGNNRCCICDQKYGYVTDAEIYYEYIEYNEFDKYRCHSSCANKLVTMFKSRKF